MKPLFILPLLLFSGIVQGQISKPDIYIIKGGKLDTTPENPYWNRKVELAYIDMGGRIVWRSEKYVIWDSVSYKPHVVAPFKVQDNNNMSPVSSFSQTKDITGGSHIDSVLSGIANQRTYLSPDTDAYFRPKVHLLMDSIYIQPFSVYISPQCKPTDTTYTTDGNTALQAIRYRFTQDKKAMQLIVTNYNDGSVWRFRKLEVGELEWLSSEHLAPWHFTY